MRGPLAVDGRRELLEGKSEAKALRLAGHRAQSELVCPLPFAVLNSMPNNAPGRAQKQQMR